MTAMSRRPFFLFVLSLGAVLIASAAPARADGPDPDAIVRSLLPKPKAPVFRSLFNRGIAVDPGDAPEAPPQVDLVVNFAFDSATLTSDGALTLSALGKALMDHRLDGLRFRIIGHTDARGLPAYNLTLSEQRAQTVGAFLYQFYQIDRSRLDLYGRGASELRDPRRPEDGINRRVQVVTIVPPPEAQAPPPGPAPDRQQPTIAPDIIGNGPK
jgi:outer membrane protein OmpA-like peptidoglycan-associated protein